MALFGDYLKHLRMNELKMSQEEFCNTSTICKTKLDKVERGIFNFNKSEVEKICCKLKIHELNKNTLMELSYINDCKSFHNLSKVEQGNIIKDQYLSSIISGDEQVTWDTAEKNSINNWSKGEQGG